MLDATLLLLATTFANASPASSANADPWAPIALGDAVSGFTTPVDIKPANDGSKRLFVVQQDGLIKTVQNGKITGTFLDAKAVVGAVGGEQGLLGIAFHPKFKENGRFFIAYTDLKKNDAVAELKANADHTKAELASLKVLFAIPDFAPNHNGGNLVFHDGLLYVGTGDGGGAGDPQRTAQNPDVLLGKMLRVDVDAKKPKPEVLYVGLRNPWRYSFDAKTGDLWIADVGQDTWEEVDFVPAADVGKKGLNFGWSAFEGTHCFRPKEGCDAAIKDSAKLVAPIWEYHHGEDGCSITGGFVYRGKQFASLEGSYVVADFCSGRIWEMKHTDASTSVALALDLKAQTAISSFGEDEDGELWVADYNKGAIRHVVTKK